MGNNTHRHLVNILFEEVLNQQKLEMIKDVLSKDFVLYAREDAYRGLKACREVLDSWHHAFPDLHFEIETIIEATDRTLALSWRARGTQQGIFLGIAPTNRQVDFTGLVVFKIKNNKFTEAWISADMPKVMNTLKVFSNKIYNENDFSVDFAGPASKIYDWVMTARPVPSCKQKMANAVRELFSMVPPRGSSEEYISKELYEKVDQDEILISGNDRKVRAFMFTPKAESAAPRPIVIYFHGGGWTTKNPEVTELITRKLALYTDMIILSVDYSLAPEKPFPEGLDDGLTVYEWVKQGGAAEIGGDSTRVALAGDSSGGNIALALALRARDEGRMPDAVLALCPATDFVMEKYDSVHRLGTNGLIYDFSFYSYARSVYAPYEKWTHPYVSPMYGDWRQFCPICIISAGQDLLIDDNLFFVHRLRQAGNKDVEIHTYEQMPHGFFYFLGFTKEEENCFQAMSLFLKRVFKGEKKKHKPFSSNKEASLAYRRQ